MDVKTQVAQIEQACQNGEASRAVSLLTELLPHTQQGDKDVALAFRHVSLAVLRASGGNKTLLENAADTLNSGIEQFDDFDELTAYLDVFYQEAGAILAERALGMLHQFRFQSNDDVNGFFNLSLDWLYTRMFTGDVKAMSTLYQQKNGTLSEEEQEQREHQFDLHANYLFYKAYWTPINEWAVQTWERCCQQFNARHIGTSKEALSETGGELLRQYVTLQIILNATAGIDDDTEAFKEWMPENTGCQRVQQCLNMITGIIDVGLHYYQNIFYVFETSEMRNTMLKDFDKYVRILQKYDRSFTAPARPSAARANVLAKQSGGCYVATAVYGSYDCPQVWTLRRYRDHRLAGTWYGRAFIRTYYAVSPTLVRWFGHTNWFKTLWRGKLDRMVSRLQEQGIASTPYDDQPW